jgi:hypothetical protein
MAATAKLKYTISRIENFFSMLLTQGKVSENIYIGELPPTTDAKMDDFVLVDVGKQSAEDAYSVGYVNIYLYARPTDTTLKKNIKKLYSMENLLDAALDGSEDKTYVLSELYRDSGYDTTRQFHYNIIGLTVVVR